MLKEYDHINHNNFYDPNNCKLDPLSESQSELNSSNKEQIVFLSLGSNCINKNDINIGNNYKKDINNNKINTNFANDIFVNKENNEMINNFKEFSLLEDNKFNLYEALSINDSRYKVDNNNEKKNEEFSNTIRSIKGKNIKTYNKKLSDTMIGLFNTDEINFDNKTDMQLLRIKNRRRTKKELESAKMNKSKEIIQNKKKGRNKKQELKKEEDTHTKTADDNIIKKLNSNFLKNVLIWLNSSFINERGEFCSPIKPFKKIKPIFTSLKKNKVTELMKTKFKCIFSNDVSVKYKNVENNYNKNIIDDIYKEKKQYFVIFILELTFIEVFSIYNGEISVNGFKNLLLEKNPQENRIIEEAKIIKFYEKFNKINSFLNKIYSEEIALNNRAVVEDYIQRISLLSVNYEKWFERKFDRKSKKN